MSRQDRPEGFSEEAARRVLAGECRALYRLVDWMRTREGVDYWMERADGIVPLSADDLDLIRSWLGEKPGASTLTGPDHLAYKWLNERV